MDKELISKYIDRMKKQNDLVADLLNIKKEKTDEASLPALLEESKTGTES